MEHRLERRVSVNIPVWLDFQDGTCGIGFAANISEGGLFVATVDRPGSRPCLSVRMTVGMPDGKRTVTFRAMIVRQSTEGLGLMFRSVDGAEREGLDWLLSLDDSSCFSLDSTDYSLRL